jgi:hypothetical protein
MAAIVPVQDAITGSEPQSNLAELLRIRFQRKPLAQAGLGFIELSQLMKHEAAEETMLGGFSRIHSSGVRLVAARSDSRPR